MNRRNIYTSRICLRTFPVLLSFFFFITAYSQGDAQLEIKGQTSAKSRAKGLGLNSGVKAVDWKEEPMEGVEIEVKKNDVTIAKTTSGKKGKYAFQIPVSTADAKNDFVIIFSKEGMGPKMIHVNAYIPKEEFSKHSAAKYDFSVDIPLISTTVKDVVPDKPFAKILWDKVKEHKFSNQAYEKIALSEEQKILGNPDQYYAAIAKKRKKAEEALAKNKAAADAKLKAAEEEAKRKADEEAKRLAAIKAKEEAERLEKERAEALRKEMIQKRINDSLAEVARKKALAAASASSKTETLKEETPVPDVIVSYVQESSPLYDASEKYSINIARRSLSEERERRSKERGKNLTAKYETTNVLTSLLNMVDEFDAVNKKR